MAKSELPTRHELEMHAVRAQMILIYFYSLNSINRFILQNIRPMLPLPYNFQSFWLILQNSKFV